MLLSHSTPDVTGHRNVFEEQRVSILQLSSVMQVGAPTHQHALHHQARNRKSHTSSNNITRSSVSTSNRSSLRPQTSSARERSAIKETMRRYTPSNLVCKRAHCDKRDYATLYALKPRLQESVVRQKRHLRRHTLVPILWLSKFVVPKGSVSHRCDLMVQRLCIVSPMQPTAGLAKVRPCAVAVLH